MDTLAALQRKRFELQRRIAGQRETLRAAASGLRAGCGHIDRLKRTAARHPAIALAGAIALGFTVTRYRHALRWARHLPLLFTVYRSVRQALRRRD